ncbi:hypothetical protein, partial [Klebsiella pneumoniae]|uniref:hypothetical protein n=1 Tax=Klebsiella pneumoniae TaxID=573 RepID=UPI001C8F55BF
GFTGSDDDILSVQWSPLTYTDGITVHTVGERAIHRVTIYDESGEEVFTAIELSDITGDFSPGIYYVSVRVYYKNGYDKYLDDYVIALTLTERT